MEAFVTSIVLIVAVVPEGLPTIVAISLSINIIKLSRENALVKKLIASETIGAINVTVHTSPALPNRTAFAAPLHHIPDGLSPFPVDNTVNSHPFPFSDNHLPPLHAKRAFPCLPPLHPSPSGTDFLTEPPVSIARTGQHPHPANTCHPEKTARYRYAGQPVASGTSVSGGCFSLPDEEAPVSVPPGGQNRAPPDGLWDGVSMKRTPHH